MTDAKTNAERLAEIDTEAKHDAQRLVEIENEISAQREKIGKFKDKTATEKIRASKKATKAKQTGKLEDGRWFSSSESKRIVKEKESNVAKITAQKLKPVKELEAERKAIVERMETRDRTKEALLKATGQ